MISNGWPQSKSQLDPGIRPFWSQRDEMSVVDGIVYRGLQAVVPADLHHSMLQKAHASHAGAESCIRMCKDIIYWPGMRAAIKDMCDNCGKCAQYASQHTKETMKSQPVPVYAWQLVSQDLMHFEGCNYLITIDHYSDFIEMDELDDTLSMTIVNKSKAHFARYGIPEQLISDNGPQFISTDFAKFCDEYGIKHETSSPYWPQGNGKAEAAVKTVKSFMNKSADLQLALLMYRNTPLQGHTLSPAQRCLGRRTHTNIPTSRQQLIPNS